MGEMPTGGGKFRATGFIAQGGGMAATGAVTVALLGAKASFWGRAGDDAAGHVMQNEFACYQVDTSQFRLFPGARSSVSAVIVDRNGERMIVNFPGANMPGDADWLNLDDIAATGAVLGDVRWPQGVSRAFAAANRHGIPTVLDAEAAGHADFARLLPLTGHAIFSVPGLRSFCGGRITDHFEALASVRTLGCSVVAVTMGAQGALWLDDNGEHHQPAFHTSVVDTTGAGDVFHGAYALALAEGADVPAAMRFASAAAALKCTRQGGRAGIPTRDEVNQFLAQNP
ncbi:MAG: sugar kinase [Burkholderiaceae bacterium]|nr:sugar kinase [Burkholderiaceae bacterium]